MESRCDGISDCHDSFDEINCTMILFDSLLYRKEYPPLQKDLGQASVSVDFTEIEVSAIDEFLQIFHASFLIQLTW